MKNLFLTAIAFTSIFTCGVSAQKKELSLEQRPIYKVHKATSKIKIDGKLKDVAWFDAETRTFDHFYLTSNDSEKQKTNFRMLWDKDYIYIHYDLQDKFINAAETKRDGAPYLDDCTEIFLTPAPSAENIHYCFEINVNKAINDLVFVNNFNGGNAVVRQYNPDFKLGVDVKGTINDNTDIDKGWSMELAIPHAAFAGSTSKSPIAIGSKWAFLALRQIRDNNNIGKRVMSTIFPVDNIKEKDVHQPEMFGLLEFVD